MDALAAPPKRLGEGGDRLRGEPLAGFLDGERHALGADPGVDPHGAVFRQVVDDRVPDEVRGRQQQERRRPGGRGDVPLGFEGDPVFLRQGQEDLGGLLRHRGQVDRLPVAAGLR
ncbi:hypothetical protein [Nocardiopsis sp. CC223A]|uniref:hypothetical protein n=1 Tax=Nocardiopsis sp. CC223A TaxID=3044051 RepID=UPI00278BE159|nr:hypothetical protein [Nocardiopsis sp. CC223A]